jgi:hypothetical protein
LEKYAAHNGYDIGSNPIKSSIFYFMSSNFLLKNNILLTILNKNLNYNEFELIFKFLKKFNFIQLYKYFKTFELIFHLPNLCFNCIQKLETSELLNIKLIKFFFLINCIQFIKKKNLINFIFNNSDYNLNSFEFNKIDEKFFFNIFSFKVFSNFYLKEKILKKKKKNLNQFLITSEIYKSYKGVIIPFNISNLSWLVRAGLKYEMK